MIYDRKVSLLTLTGENRGEVSAFRWESTKEFWASYEEPGKTNLFSRIGIGAKTAIFQLRKIQGISLHNGLWLGGRFYFLTAIREDSPLQMELTAAQVTPAECTVLRGKELVDENTKQSEREEPKPVLQFPGIMTEKYLGYQQLEPMAQTSETYILVASKQILLEAADLVELWGARYAVRVRHLLDEYKNEYEITKVGDI